MPIRNPRRFPISNTPAFPQPPVTPRLYRNIALSFFGLTLIIVGGVVWMSSVKATVKVKAKRDLAKIGVAVQVAKSPEQGELGGRIVESTEFSTQEFQVKEQAAGTVNTITKGKVRIINKYSKDQTLVKTTRLLTADGKLFRISANVSVGSGETVEVDAYSDQPGSEFAISSGVKFTIPGLWVDLRKWIYAEAISPFTGESKQKRIVTQTDILDAQKVLEEAVVEQAKNSLITNAGLTTGELSDDCQDASCWEAVYFVTPLEKKTNASIGDEAETFLAQVKIKVVGVFYLKKDMDALIRSKVKEGLSEGRDLVDFDMSHLAFKLDKADVSKERATIAFSTDASTRLTTQSPLLAPEAILGLGVDEAKEKLSSVDGVEYVEITLKPSWARKIPTRKDAVSIMIE